MNYEKTLVILKPDAVRRKLCGRLIKRFEDAGLDILQLKVCNPASAKLISEHYQSTDEWLRGVGEKTLKSYREHHNAKDAIQRDFGSDDPKKIGEVIKQRLIAFMTSGPLIAIVLGGNHAIRKVRSLAGYTIPAEAAPGTIRADFSSDSPDLATAQNRSVENLIHASGNPEEANYEIDLWFNKSDVTS
jgi:nucleoside-diphosphate kinase